MNTKTLLVLIMLAALIISGCQYGMQLPNQTGQEYTINLTLQNETAEQEQETPLEEEEELMIPEQGIVIEATEGDLVELRPEAIDPDGDAVSYFFTEPFNENGRWQTNIGDQGQYLVTVTASDGKAETKQDVLVIIHKGNMAPVVECPEEIIVDEGEKISLDCNIYDPEGESIIVEYSGFMKSSTYETGFEDAGEYSVQISARDKDKTTTEAVKIRILNVNRAPEISGVPDQITAMETEIVSLNPEASDADGDDVTIIFSEPFNDQGVWKTSIGDAGVYEASVVANDGESAIKKRFTLTITHKNTPPVLEEIKDITVSEGDAITLPIKASDREDDDLEVTIKGWMNSESYTTTYDDAGEYTVTVIVSDGEFEDKQTFSVTVLDKNRPPVFKVPA